MSNEVNLEVVSVNLSREKGTVKHPVPEIEITAEGVAGDAHAGAWHRQVSLLGRESIDRFIAETGRETRPGEFAENITTRGLDLKDVGIGDRFSSGELDLEVTQLGKECHGNACAIFREVGKCVMPSEGLFCRVLTPGRLKPGNTLVYHRVPLAVRVVTLSDRASRGDYEDRSGPAVEEQLAAFFAGKPWHLQVERSILPDNADRLRRELAACVNAGCGIVITTGGTGVGPRDFTPETVAAFCDRIVPGIMESIRVTCGATNPRALLSRSVAGVKGACLVYALPGSVRAVTEYMTEIVKTLEHLLLTVRGIDTH